MRFQNSAVVPCGLGLIRRSTRHVIAVFARISAGKPSEIPGSQMYLSQSPERN